MISPTKPKDFCVALLLLGVAGVLYYKTIALSEGISHALGPAFFPRILIYLLAALSIVLLWQSTRKCVPQENAAELEADNAPVTDEAQEKDKKAERGASLLQWGFVALLFLYLVFLPDLEYAPGTILFLFISMMLLGPRKKRNIIIYIIVSFAVTYALQFIFGTMLHLFLP